MSIIESEAIKLHVDATGNVWSLCGNGPPVETGLNPLLFLLQHRTHLPLSCRLLGLPQNAALITALYAMETTPHERVIELASPRVCMPNELGNPERVLLAMRQLSLISSMGGWHSMTITDANTYALVKYLLMLGHVDDHAIRLLKAHPIWPALSFVFRLDTAACCELVATLMDPRYYINPCRPDRVSSLHTFLGLTPKVFERAMLGGQAASEHRARLVLRCWRPDNEANWPTAGDTMRPETFPWRAAEKHGRTPKGWLRGSQLFVVFLRHVWLDAIYKNAQQRERLFAPDMFFKPFECRAFVAHVAKQQED